MSEQPTEPTISLQVLKSGEILLGLPDRDTNVVVTIELRPKAARELGEELFKLGTNAEPSAPDTGQHPAP